MSASDPYKIVGPACISFSGGRTSGYMLRRILDRYDGVLPSDVHVCFANTGKERNETLDFVHECELRWGVQVAWLEYPYHVVSYEIASRAGEPFMQLIRERNYLPNPVSRFCTQELKIRVMRNHMRDTLGYDYWTNVVGLRADEPRRIARIHNPERQKERWDVLTPLNDAGVTEQDVLSYWKHSPFDLQLRSYEGNCDLCFLKGAQKRVRIMRDHPELARWWIEAEAEAEALSSAPSGARFRVDMPSYFSLFRQSQQPMLPFAQCDLDGPDNLADCMCTD